MTNTDKPTLYIGWMLGRHVREVAEIERDCHPLAMSRAEIRKANRKWQWITLVATVVSGNKEHVAGYLSFRRHDTVYVVHRAGVGIRYRGTGIGDILFTSLEGRLGDNVKSICVRVPETCVGMQLYLRKRGYYADSIEPGRWDDSLGPRDFYIFRYGVNHASVRTATLS